MPARFELMHDSPPKSRKWPTQASTQYDENELDSFSAGNGRVNAGATNTKILGLAGETKASTDTSTDRILINIIRSFDELLANVSAGTMSATEIGNQADIVDEDSITLTESNEDFTIVDFNGVTDEAVVVSRKSNGTSATGTIY